MAGEDGCLLGQGEELAADAVQLSLEVAAGQVGAPYAALEERVAAEKEPGAGDVERGRAGGVAGGVDEADGCLPQAKFVAVAEETLYGRHPASDGQAELCGHVGHLPVGLGLVGVEDGPQPVGAMDEGKAQGVVEVGVGLEGILELQAEGCDAALQQLFLLPVPHAGVHDGSLKCLFVPEQIGVLLNRIEGESLVFHRGR